MLKFSLRIYLFLLLLTLFFDYSLPICVPSYQNVECENIDDYEKFYDPTWTDVIIQSEASDNVNQVSFKVVKFRNLNSVTLIGQISELGDSDNTCVYEIKLRSLTFYGNLIKSIKKGNFVRFLNLHKLGLVNNNIENIEPEAFSLPLIENIDLSDNKIEKIEKDTFTSEFHKFGTKTISIKNNRLSFIEPGSFPSGLEILQLDNNNLEQLEDGVLDNLDYLQVLHLSHNQLYYVPNITQLYRLKILDMSFNNIESIDENDVKSLRNLEIFDLTRNKITSVSFLHPLLQKNNPLEVFLNFNLIDTMDDLEINHEYFQQFDFTNKFIDLRGNPFSCDSWFSVKKFMKNRRHRRSVCDLENFESRIGPICKASASQSSEEFVKQVYELMHQDEDLLQCASMKNRYGNLFYKRSIDIQCNTHG